MFGPPNVAKLAAAGKIDELVKAANHKKDPAVRDAARAALTEKLDTIIQSLQTKNMIQLENARKALVVIGPPARDRLVFILREGHIHRRQDAAFVLGMMKDPDPEVLKALMLSMHNPDPLLRMLCVQALGRIGDPSAFDTIRRATGDADPSVSGAARKALKAMGATPAG